ncbi:MAG: CoA transferase [Myxococcales bacterium]|nr:CoA transferase [Myxococcales bacterium]
MAGALQGVRVLDFTGLVPGPFATMLLADLGADVVRIDGPDRPDLLRYLAPFDQDGEGTAWRMANRGKKSLLLDLKAPGAVDLVKRLVRDVDVVVEQFRPGVMDRLGLGYDALRAVNPGLVYCAITAWGQTGPWRDRPGHDNGFLATAGLAATQHPAGPHPMGALVGDIAGGTWPAVAGILAALLYRERTGQGQLVDVAMGDGALFLNAVAAAGALAGAAAASPAPGALTGGGVYGYYRTRDGGWLAVGALEPKFWAMACAAFDRPDWIDLDPTDAVAICAVQQGLADVIGSRDLAHWRAMFAALPCCVEPVLSPAEAVRHPVYRDRAQVAHVATAAGGLQWQVAAPFRLSATPTVMGEAAHKPGADTDAVLAAAGFDAEEIERLRAAGVAA